MCRNERRNPGVAAGSNPPRGARFLLAGFEVQPDHVVKKLGIYQHVKSNGDGTAVALDECATDLVMDAENFEEEVVWHLNLLADLEDSSSERDRSDQAANLPARAEMMADEYDAARAVDDKIFERALGCGVLQIKVRLKGHVTLRCFFYCFSVIFDC
jgi:hypothetical protein